MSALPALLSIMLEPEAEPVVAVAVVLAVVAELEPAPDRAQASGSLPPQFIRYRCEPLPGQPPVPIMRLREHHCRWVVGPDGSSTFCGADKGVRDDGELSPYCPTHQRFAFRPNQMAGAAYVKSTLRWATK